jgi:hypothetical protein
LRATSRFPFDIAPAEFDLIALEEDDDESEPAEDQSGSSERVRAGSPGNACIAVGGGDDGGTHVADGRGELDDGGRPSLAGREQCGDRI